jgi:hypothetical protein
MTRSRLRGDVIDLSDVTRIDARGEEFLRAQGGGALSSWRRACISSTSSKTSIVTFAAAILLTCAIPNKIIRNEAKIDHFKDGYDAIQHILAAISAIQQ